MPTLQPGSTSQAFDVDIGQTVSVTPGSGGTMLVEYTTNSETDIRNGSATWQAWTAGVVSTATSDVAMFPLFARVTAYTVAGSYELSGSGLRAVPNQYLAWKSDVVSARDPASAAAVVGAAGVVSIVPADLLANPSTTTTGDGISALTPYQIAAPGTYTKVRLYWRNISASADRVLYIAANAPNATRGLKQSQDAKRRDASMVFGDHIMLVSAAPITSLVFSSDGSISANTHNLMISWGN